MRAECIRTIEELALSDPRVIVVASDPAADFMPELAAKHPERFLVEGVCEQGLVGMSAGLASEGYYPFFITLSVFATRRCYEQLLLDFGLHQLAGCIVGYGGGLSYAPLGPTHIAVDDIALFSAIPGAAILCPGEPAEAAQLTRQALGHAGLSYMRMAGTTDHLPAARGEIVLGKGRVLADSGSVLFVSCGAASLAVQSALPLLRETGIDTSAVHIHTIKPLDAELIRRYAMGAKVIICVEEHRQTGGLATAVLHALATAERGIASMRFASVGVDDAFPTGHGTHDELLQKYGITGAQLAERARAMLSTLREGKAA